MTTSALMGCLQAIKVPAGVEEWLRPEQTTSVQISDDYTRGVHDVLAALGALSPETSELSSPMAYYFVRSLLASIRDKALTSMSWQDLPDEPCSGVGAQLVRLLEENRLACCDNSTPLRIVTAVTAVIKARRASDDVYLMQYDARARQFQPIGGKQELYDADSIAALTRELCEELAIEGIQVERDFKAVQLAKSVRVNEVSASLHVLTQYDHSFYHLTDVYFPISTDSDTRWLTAAEMSAGKTVDGLAITTLFEDFIPGVLPTLGYSLTAPLGQ
jgi:hypothetical protein